MPEQTFIIRTARPEDLDSLTGLLQELFAIEADFTADAARQKAGLKQLIIKADAIVLAAEVEGKTVGMCTVQTVISTAEGGPAGLLEDMVISRKYRRRGIGQALLTAAGEWAEKQGLTRLHLLVETDNTAALDFYSATGWQTTGLVCRRKSLKKCSQTVFAGL